MTEQQVITIGTELPTIRITTAGISVPGPKGDKGDKGDPGTDSTVPGPQGPQGEGAYVVEGDWESPPAELDEGEFLYDPDTDELEGVTVAVGTVTTGSPGGDAEVVNSGTGPDVVLDFTIPQGPVGPQGDGALVDEGDVDAPPVDLLEGEFLYDPTAEPALGESAITQDQADARYVNTDVNGDTMAGNLDIDKHWPTVTLDGSDTGPARVIFSREGNEDAILRGDSSGAFAIIVPGGPTSGSIRVNRADGSVALTGAAYVSLPPPTANVHAARKQDVDAKVSKDGDTMSGSLTVPNPHRFYQGYQEDQNLGSRFGSVIMQRGGDKNSSVILTVRGPDSTHYLNILKDGRVQMASATSVEVPAPTAATHVPRLARTPDPTTGDLGLPGFAGSSTGWRDVSADIEPGYGWTGGTVLIRRDGYRVEMQVYDLTNDSTTGEAQNFYRAPVDGFRRRLISAGDITHVNHVVGVGQAAAPTTTAKGDDLASVVLAGNGVLIRIPYWMTTFTAQWTTTIDWPSTLPGTEVSPPASWS